MRLLSGAPGNDEHVFTSSRQGAGDSSCSGESHRSNQIKIQDRRRLALRRGGLLALVGALGLDLSDRIDHGIEGQHGRGMPRLVVAHGLQKGETFVLGSVYVDPWGSRG